VVVDNVVVVDVDVDADDDDDHGIYPIHRFPKSCIFNETNAKKTVSTGKVLGFGVHETCHPASQYVH